MLKLIYHQKKCFYSLSFTADGIIYGGTICASVAERVCDFVMEDCGLQFHEIVPANPASKLGCSLNTRYVDLSWTVTVNDSIAGMMISLPEQGTDVLPTRIDVTRDDIAQWWNG